jgi:multidrug efflux pump
VTRYNGFPSADINGAAKPGFSSGQAEAEIEKLLKGLPRGMGYEWTELSYQDRLTRNVTLPVLEAKLPTLGAVLLLSVVLVVLVLAAQYESWSLPLAIIMIVPMCILSAPFGVWLSHFPPFGQAGDLNVFTQVALVVLVGLACKNAILIVEFANAQVRQGREVVAATLDAARVRLRPILMTSLAFGLGVLPLAIAAGAGSGSQNAIGTGVLGGTILATALGTVFVPLFYIVIKRWFGGTSVAADVTVPGAVSGAEETR